MDAIATIYSESGSCIHTNFDIINYSLSILYPKVCRHTHRVFMRRFLPKQELLENQLEFG